MNSILHREGSHRVAGGNDSIRFEANCFSNITSSLNECWERRFCRFKRKQRCKAHFTSSGILWIKLRSKNLRGSTRVISISTGATESFWSSFSLCIKHSPLTAASRTRQKESSQRLRRAFSSVESWVGLHCEISRVNKRKEIILKHNIFRKGWQDRV